MDDRVLLSVKGVSKSFLGVKALDQVDLEARVGEVMGVIGENGAGKSTLMNVIFGSLKRDEGTIEFDGKPVDFENPAEALHSGISMIHQETSLVQQFTVSENIWLGMEDRFMHRGVMDNRGRDEASRKLFDSLGLDIDEKLVVSLAPMAICQLVEVARAVACDAKLIIMDEPTSSLSDREVAVLFKIIRDLSEKGITVIYISHKIEELQQICDRLSVYRDGKYIGTYEMSELTYDEIVSKVVGRKITNLYPKQKVEIGEVIFEAKHLTGYGKFQDVSFELHKGEILGFAGLQGAGRSEVLESIFGVTRLDEGELYLDGKKITISRPSEAVEYGFGMVTEDRLRSGIIAQLSVQDNLSLVRLGEFCTKHLGILKKNKEAEACRENIELMQVKVSDMQQRIDSLSGGNQQKVIVGRWIMTTPRIMILDEPTRGIDVGSKSEIHRLMGEFVKEGMSIILISSEMPEVLGMSDRIIVMRDGKVVLTANRDEVDQDTLGKYALG